MIPQLNLQRFSSKIKPIWLALFLGSESDLGSSQLTRPSQLTAPEPTLAGEILSRWIVIGRRRFVVLLQTSPSLAYAGRHGSAKSGRCSVLSSPRPRQRVGAFNAGQSPPSKSPRSPAPVPSRGHHGSRSIRGCGPCPLPPQLFKQPPLLSELPLHTSELSLAPIALVELPVA